MSPSEHRPIWLAGLEAGFSGRVVDEQDHPLAGALVFVWKARPVGASGSLTAGTVSDRARLRSGPSLQLIASTQEPAAVAGPESMSLGSGAVAAARTGADGRFALPILPAASYVLFAIHFGPPVATSELLAVNEGFLATPLRLTIPRSGVPLL